MSRVAVCSRSFSKNKVLRSELLERYSDVTFNDLGKSLVDQELIDFLEGHDKAIVALERIDENILSSLPNLKVISKYGVGLDMIDIQAMRQYGKLLGWIPGVNRRSVAELVVAFSIMLLRHIRSANEDVLSGNWRQHSGSQLTGKTFGIIGCGNVGKDLATLLKVFDCEILAYDILIDQPVFDSIGIKSVELEVLLKNADIVSIHTPYDETTSNMINEYRMGLMKENFILINTARGGLVDEDALKKILKERPLASAAFDVLADEPPVDGELLGLPNFVVTPHIGGSSEEAILAMGRAAIIGLDQNKLP